jgi:3-oxoacyl-[acyl-carrier-protein] synthase II
VTGASRSFMGEEQAGADALRIAAARLAEGDSAIALVGGAYSAPRWDMMALHHAGGLLRQGGFAPVFSRMEAPGAVPGTQAGFLVIETAAHARARGVRGLARLGAVVSARARRTPADRGIEAMGQAYARLAPRLGEGRLAVVSGCTGIAGVTELEREFLGGLARPLAVRAAGNRFGWGVEASFPASVAMAALALAAGALPAPLETLEAPFEGAPRDILVTGFGAWRGEALAHLAAIPEEEQP